ncbi:MAG: NAD(P)/FAD-dependent oxidoreductase [Planctomycetota bacterium]
MHLAEALHAVSGAGRSSADVSSVEVSTDVAIVGGGISGLVDAILLAETGRSVHLFEQHTVPGGYLQQFRRKKTTFDVGFHYLGSTGPGLPLRQFLEHLQVWSRLEFEPLPEDQAITVRHGDRSFGYPGRFDRFHEKCVATWPGERVWIDRFVELVDATCRQFQWFALRDGEYAPPHEIERAGESLAHLLSGGTELLDAVEDPWLREVLGLMSFHIGLTPEEIPWVKHCLAFRSTFDRTSRIRGGGGALVAALIQRGRELGVEYHLGEGVERFDCEGRQLTALETSKGRRVRAELFVAACHPKVVLARIPDEHLKPMYKERVERLRESRGAVQCFVRLKAPLKSIGAECVMLREPAGFGGELAGLKLDPVLVTQPSTVDGPPRLELMTYLDQAPFAQWRGTPVFKRGDGYEELKAQLRDRMLALATTVAPELPGLIEDVYTATPLTDEFYTKNVEGGVFGISHDVGQMGLDRPLKRLRLRNLFYTGHSILMPGICGTFINAFETCDGLRGGGLFEEVRVG